MLLKRLPRPALRPFVTMLWASDAPVTPSLTKATREHVLPTGAMHLVFRLSDHPLRLFDSSNDLQGQTLGFSLVGGARSRFYIRDISLSSSSVGAVLRPGVAELLFGAKADELAERHTPLVDLWGASVDDIHGLLFDAPHPTERIALLESVLAARLPQVHSMHPAIADAIEKFHALESINAMVRRSGFSHRQFIALFRRAVGLSPKTYARVLRFQTALLPAARCASGSGAAIALEAGYSDQAHFNREFLEFAGVTPATYQKYSPT